MPLRCGALAFTLGLAVLPGQAAFSQQLPNMSLGQNLPAELGASVLQVRILDEGALFSASLFGQRVFSEIDVASRALEQENTELLDQLTRRELELTEARGAMAPADFRAAADAFDIEAEAIRRSQAEKRARLGSYQDAEQRRFFLLAGPVLQELLVQSGAQLVIDARAVILGVDGIDLTRDAIAAVDTALGDGAPAPTPLAVP